MVSAPLFSHTDWGGYLKTAQALQALGHQVIWVSGESLRPPVTAAGIPFAAVAQTGWLWPPPPVPDLTQMPPQAAVMLRYSRALDTWLSEDLVGDATQALIDLAKEIGAPDVLVTDPFLSAAALSAEALGVPLAVCGWLAQRELNEDGLFPVQKSLAHESLGRVQRLLARFGLKGVNFSQGVTPSVQSPQLHLCYFTASWYQAEAGNTLPQTRFVGGSPTPSTAPLPGWLTEIPPDAPLALITLGTTFTGDLGFYSWAAQAAARGGYTPLVVIGWNPITPADKQMLLRSLPGGARLLNFVPFDQVLPRVRLMLHHGGMGTTHAAVIHGIPQIVVPHAADQRGQARRVAQSKVGLNLSAHDVRQGMLTTAVQAIAKDAAVHANAQRLAAEMEALGGAESAAALLSALGNKV
ncbi:MAG: glycosyltransferase family 1 protein [Armatimonadetes bacterium]|nr:glycosyltransferase family 1 protein [Anaerolineae bacterium]